MPQITINIIADYEEQTDLKEVLQLVSNLEEEIAKMGFDLNDIDYEILD